MNILAIICTTFPAFVSVMILSKKEDDNKKLFLSYFLYNIIINILCIFCTIIYKKDTNLMLDLNFGYFQFCARYLLLSLFLASVAPYVLDFIDKNIKISIEVRKNKHEKKGN